MPWTTQGMLPVRTYHQTDLNLESFGTEGKVSLLSVQLHGTAVCQIVLSTLRPLVMSPQVSVDRNTGTVKVVSFLIRNLGTLVSYDGRVRGVPRGDMLLSKVLPTSWLRLGHLSAARAALVSVLSRTSFILCHSALWPEGLSCEQLDT